MRAILLIYSTLALAACFKESVKAQQIDERLQHRLMIETIGKLNDSTEVSKLAYDVSYGSFESKHRWNLSEHIDSSNVNSAVKRILENPETMQSELASLEPCLEPYQTLKRTVDSLIATRSDSLIDWEKIRHAFNEYALINRLPDDMIVLVNIPSATLRLVNRKGELLLKCAVIVGSPSTPTPIFGAHITRIITYPYWNVPRSIAIKEFLPKIKRDPEGFMNAMKMQVISAEGVIVSPESINWNSLSSRNFPFRLRQSTGCDNALGVIKFDIDSPYDVYLHDTNHRELFNKKYRFLSHGCIRVEEPIRLANLLMQKQLLPETFTEDRLQNIPSKVFPLPKKIPVVITYIEVEAENGLTYHSDIYNRTRLP